MAQHGRQAKPAGHTLGKSALFKYNKPDLLAKLMRISSFLFRVVVAVFALSFLGLPSSSPANAAVTTKEPYPYGYTAKELTRSDKKIELAAGESHQFTIIFKNTGNKTWYREGTNYVSLYTHGPRYRLSPFSDASWITAETQPAKLKEDAVKPGATGTFSFTLFAPLKAGTYHETFAIAAEHLAFATGGTFSIDILVDPKKQLLADQESLPGLKLAPGFKAQMLLVSEHSLAMNAGQTKEFRVGFKNIGRTDWKKGSTAIRAVSQIPLRFRDTSWQNTVVSPLTSDIKPGQLAFFTIALSAPTEGGSFTPSFNLANNEDLIDGGEVEIPIEVRENKAPAEVEVNPNTLVGAAGNRGPDIRVGVYFLDTITEPVRITASGSYALFDGPTNKIQPLSGITTITFNPANKQYRVENGSFIFTPAQYPRLVPDDAANTIMQVLSLDERPTWDTSINYNQFRGSLEVRYNDSKNRVWVIEQLPLEDYMRGLGETSNGSPIEYQKALITAARTYAAYIIELGGKHASEYFNVNRTGDDQVYKGYVSELIRPAVVQAVEATRGQMITYQGDIVVTPYFSRSEGRTRSWSEVWNGSKPWLVSKPAEYDQAAGRTLWGHGVGMSAADAVDRAKAGVLWQDLLKYYYTGIEIKSIY